MKHQTEWDAYFDHLESQNIFECIQGKDVLEIATATGNFWKLYKKYNPSSVTGLDPDTRWILEDDVDENCIVRESFDTYLPKKQFDVIVCFGLIYKLANPIQLLELIARSEPSYVILEDLMDNTGPYLRWRELSGINTFGNLVTNEQINSQIVLLPNKEVIEAAMRNMGYTLELCVTKKILTDDKSFGKKLSRQYLFKKD